MVSMVAAAIALIPTAALADEGRGGGQKNHFGPYSGASTDSGTCGNDWANDTFKRDFFVQPAGAGSWRVTEAFTDGRFVTMSTPNPSDPTNLGASPGACQTSTPHGRSILAGKTGNFGGFLSGTVTGGTYNPNGCNVPGACSTTTGFIAAVFGPTATYSCQTGPGACSFYFSYSASDQGLIYRHWVNASDDLGGNRGDIATS